MAASPPLLTSSKSAASTKPAASLLCVTQLLRTTMARDTSCSYSKLKNTLRAIVDILPLQLVNEYGDADGKSRQYAVESDQRPGKSSPQPGPRTARPERPDVHREVDLALL